VIYVPIEGLSGCNIQTKQDRCGWYTGPTLLEILDDIKMPPTNAKGPLRIPILDKMKDKDLVIHGKVENGTVSLGDKLALMPHGSFCQVLSLLDSKGQVVKFAPPGENVQIRLNIADEEQVQRGCVLCHRDTMMPVTDIFEAELQLLDLLEYKPIFSKGYNCVMHIHTWNDEITVKDIIQVEETDEKGEKIVKQKPQFARAGNKLICRIAPRCPVSLEKFETIQQMGRFTLRDESKTIAIGKVLKYKPFSKGIVGAMSSGSTAAKKTVSQVVTAQE